MAINPTYYRFWTDTFEGIDIYLKDEVSGDEVTLENNVKCLIPTDNEILAHIFIDTYISPAYIDKELLYFINVFQIMTLMKYYV